MSVAFALQYDENGSCRVAFDGFVVDFVDVQVLVGAVKGVRLKQTVRSCLLDAGWVESVDSHPGGVVNPSMAKVKATVEGLKVFSAVVEQGNGK